MKEQQHNVTFGEPHGLSIQNFCDPEEGEEQEGPCPSPLQDQPPEELQQPQQVQYRNQHQKRLLIKPKQQHSQQQQQKQQSNQLEQQLQPLGISITSGNYKKHAKEKKCIYKPKGGKTCESKFLKTQSLKKGGCDRIQDAKSNSDSSISSPESSISRNDSTEGAKKILADDILEDEASNDEASNDDNFIDGDISRELYSSSESDNDQDFHRLPQNRTSSPMPRRNKDTKSNSDSSISSPESSISRNDSTGGANVVDIPVDEVSYDDDDVIVYDVSRELCSSSESDNDQDFHHLPQNRTSSPMPRRNKAFDRKRSLESPINIDPKRIKIKVGNSNNEILEIDYTDLPVYAINGTHLIPIGILNLPGPLTENNIGQTILLQKTLIKQQCIKIVAAKNGFVEEDLELPDEDWFFSVQSLSEHGKNIFKQDTGGSLDAFDNPEYVEHRKDPEGRRYHLVEVRVILLRMMEDYRQKLALQ